MNWNPGSPTASKAVWSVPETLRGPSVVTPRSCSDGSHASNTGATAKFSCSQMPRSRPEPLSRLKYPESVSCAGRNRIVCGSPKCRRTYSREPSNPCSSAPHSASRIVRRGRAPIVRKIRITSIIAATPVVLSVAPVPAWVVSKCAPTITTSSARSVPGISARMLNAFIWSAASVSSWNVVSTCSSTRTGTSLSRIRTMRL